MTRMFAWRELKCLLTKMLNQSLKHSKFLAIRRGSKFCTHFPEENFVYVTFQLSLALDNLLYRISFVYCVGRGWLNTGKKGKWFGIHLTMSIFLCF